MYRMPLFRRHQYSNPIKIMLFISDINSFVLLKLCKVVGSIHLFNLIGKLKTENVNFKKTQIAGCLGDRLERSHCDIEWEYS